TPGPGQGPDVAIRADVEIPERKLAMTWSLRRNTDPGLPASHTVEIMFKLSWSAFSWRTAKDKCRVEANATKNGLPFGRPRRCSLGERLGGGSCRKKSALDAVDREQLAETLAEHAANSASVYGRDRLPGRPFGEDPFVHFGKALFGLMRRC